MKDNIKTTDAKNVARLTQDFNTAITRAKTDFDSQLKDVQHNTGLSLSELTTKYGRGSEEMLKGLDAITAKYGANAQQITAQYIQNMNAINNLTSDNIKTAQDLMNFNQSLADKTYNSYLSNN